MKFLLFAIAFLVVFMTSLVIHHQHAYQLSVKLGEAECKFLALSNNALSLSAEQIDCSLVHHDILMVFKVSPSSEHTVSCLLHDTLFGAGPPTNCNLVGPTS